MTSAPTLPPQLRPGDRVAIVAPASPPRGHAMLAAGRERLEQLGLAVSVGRHVMCEYGYLAGSDRERLGDLEAAFRDPSIKGIFCARGGYGVSRLMARFDPGVARRHPKVLVGFSDITILHLALQKAGVVSFWGPMPCTSLGLTAFSVRALRRVLMSAEPAGRVPFSRGRPPKVLRPGVGEGPLTGGTLSLMAASLATPYEIDTRGRIVFMEDVDEEPYRIDRLLAQLIAAGKLADASGIALGIFTGTRPRNPPGRRSLRLDEVFADHLLPLKVPLLANIAVGHVRDQLTLPYGVAARLDARAGTLELLQAAVA
ncbi:MAG: LD-carboxypeptidase [Vicinamibacterales bacterium]